MRKKIVLASASPRRKELLRLLAVPFQVDPSRMPEHAPAHLDHRERAETLAAAKALEVAKRHRRALVIGSDTIVAIDNMMLGKPEDEADARRMLRLLSGREHVAVTAVSICDSETGRTLTRSVTTTVRMKKISEVDIDAYVATGEPLDKAGSYAVQGRGALFVDRIEGDHFAVVGLPVASLAEMLRELGVDVWKTNER